jgi:hypothetical protein
MTGAKVQFAVVVGVIAVSVAFLCLLQSHFNHKWAATDKLLQRQAQRLAELSGENQRLSNLVVQAKQDAPQGGQLRELLKLRGEMGRLRQSAREMEQLRAANHDLLAAPASLNAPLPAPPDPAKVLAYWSKDQLAHAGYADPQSALKTFLWAASRGDLNSLLTSITLPADEKVDFEERVRAEDGNTERHNLGESFAPYTGFYVVGQRMPTANRTILDVYFEGEGKTRKVALEKTDQEWKFKTMGRPGQEDEDLENGTWP